MKSRLYIATPINARKEPTKKERFLAAKHLCELIKEVLSDEPWYQDYDEVITPFDVNPFGKYGETEAMGRCVTAVLESSAIYLDHGWQSSKGCNLEYRTAKLYDKVIYEHDKL